MLMRARRLKIFEIAYLIAMKKKIRITLKSLAMIFAIRTTAKTT